VIRHHTASPVYRTKAGQPITFKVTEDDPKGKLNEGWVLHRIDAFVDGRKVGYLKVSYIPRELFDRLFPNVWEYKRRVGGWHAVGVGPEASMTLTDTYLMVTKYTWMDLYNKYQRGERPTDKEMLAFLKKMEKIHAKGYQEFEAFHVDKPLVDYIRVESEWQRQGIGTALYKFGARWLARTKGLPLYASGIQSDDAKAAWKRLREPKMRIPIQEEPHPTGDSKSRARIDYRRVAARYLAGSR